MVALPRGPLPQRPIIQPNVEKPGDCDHHFHHFRGAIHDPLKHGPVPFFQGWKALGPEVQPAFDSDRQEPGKQDRGGSDLPEAIASLEGDAHEPTKGENRPEPVVMVLPSVHIMERHLVLGVANFHPVRRPIANDLLTPGAGLTRGPNQPDSKHKVENPGQTRFALSFQTEGEPATEKTSHQAKGKCHPFDGIVRKCHQGREILSRRIGDEEEKQTQDYEGSEEDEPAGPPADPVTPFRIRQVRFDHDDDICTTALPLPLPLPVNL